MNRKTIAPTFLLTLILIVLILSNLSALWAPISAINGILTPIYIGFILAFLINPIVKIFEKNVYFKIKKPRLIRILSIISAYVLVVGVLTGFMFIMVPQIVESVKDFIGNSPSYINSLVNTINSIFNRFPGTDSDVITLDGLLNKFIEIVSSLSTNIVGQVFSIFTSVIDVAKNILVGIFVSVYVLMSKERISAGARRIVIAIFKDDRGLKFLDYVGIANKKFGGYVMGNMLDCLMVGTISFIVFTIFGIPYPSLIALIVGVTNFIPFFGPFIGGIPSAIIILIANPSKVIVFLIIVLVTQQIDGNLIQPRIIGDKTGLSSLGVIFAITLMGGIFGFPGLVIGAPTIAVATVIIDDYIKHRLNSKAMPTDISEYYDDDDLIKPDDVPGEHLVNRLWDKLKNKIDKSIHSDNNEEDDNGEQ